MYTGFCRSDSHVHHTAVPSRSETIMATGTYFSSCVRQEAPHTRSFQLLRAMSANDCSIHTFHLSVRVLHCTQADKPIGERPWHDHHDHANRSGGDGSSMFSESRGVLSGFCCGQGSHCSPSLSTLTKRRRLRFWAFCSERSSEQLFRTRDRSLVLSQQSPGSSFFGG